MNTFINKIKTFSKAFALLALPLVGGVGGNLLTSCTDEWNDHYKVSTLGEGTLWESIKGNAELSNFAKVIQTVGYDKSLDGSQVFTVFAPTNASFTAEDCQAVIDQYNSQLQLGRTGNKNRAIKEFVQNHIALYNYSAAAEAPDMTIRMMNGKYVPFTNTSFGGQAFKSSNQLAGNGVLFTIADKAAYSSNVFEYVSMDQDLDSINKFLYMEKPYAFHVEKFLSKESVPGEIIDGQLHYLDSVTVFENTILQEFLDAELDNEDSSYYALMPTNEVWKEQLEQNQKYFQYDTKVEFRDSLMYTLPRLGILAGTQFSTNTNTKLGETTQLDSVKSTLAIPYTWRKQMYGTYDAKIYEYDKPYAPGGIFDGTTPVECSNGVILKADKWNVDRSNTFVREIVMEAEGIHTLDSLSGATQAAKPSWTAHNVSSDNPYYNKVSGNVFYTLSSSTAVLPSALYDFTDVLSNQKYDMYLVTAPALAGDTLTTDTLPTRVTMTVYWHDAKGNEVSKVFDRNVKTDDVVLGLGDMELQSTTRTYAATVDPKKVHQIKLGTFMFPTCSYNLDEPQVKVLLSVSLRSNEYSKFSQNLHIDQLKLVPVKE